MRQGASVAAGPVYPIPAGPLHGPTAHGHGPSGGVSAYAYRPSISR